MNKITFRPSEQEAGASVIGRLTRKDEVSFTAKDGKQRTSKIYEVATRAEIAGGLVGDVIVTIWGTKTLDELMKDVAVDSDVIITFKGTEIHGREGGLQWKQHNWEVDTA